jgi:hypothetical protein
MTDDTTPQYAESIGQAMQLQEKEDNSGNRSQMHCGRGSMVRVAAASGAIISNADPLTLVMPHY